MIPQSYYVDVNINYKKSTPLVGSVPMSVLISNTATSTKLYNTLQQVQSDYQNALAPELLAATMYFNNNGTQLLIFKQEAGLDDSTTLNSLLQQYSDFIWVSYAQNKTIVEIQTIATTLSQSTQQLPKFLAITTNIANAPTTLNAQGIENVALLYSDSTDNDNVVPYSAIVIPAYFSNINLGEADSIVSMTHTRISGVSAADIDSATLTSLYNSNWNVIVNIGNRYTTLDGAKMVSGEPIHSAWGFAVFKQNCENVVMDLLINKLPYQNSSNAIIENALSGICNQFVTNGLIGTNKIYELSDQVINYNGANYTTIRNGEVLNNGYKIFSIPIEAALQTDREIGRIPPIYIYAIINNVIRLVKITGEVSL